MSGSSQDLCHPSRPLLDQKARGSLTDVREIRLSDLTTMAVTDDRLAAVAKIQEALRGDLNTGQKLTL
jgi:hypothetical protein